MHPRHFSLTDPFKPALVMAGTGEVITYRDLEARANRGAHLMRALGLGTGDAVALLVENHPRLLEIAWAAQRAGLYLVCIPTKSTASEATYILKDCGARFLFASHSLSAVADGIAAALPDLGTLMVGDDDAFERRRDAMPDAPIADEAPGTDMLYSSGTTGRPKGIRRPLPTGGIDAPTPHLGLLSAQFGFGPDSVYLSPAPLYHAAPLRYCMTVHRLGGTAVVMERFDAENALALIERQRVTCALFVPTHFVRMLKLPEEVRRTYDLSSLRTVVHGAGPCPVQVKEAMLAWWGPIVHEYYAGTEGNGYTSISAQEWVGKKGSVGTARIGSIRICDEAGEPLPPGNEGLVYFADGPPFAYHNDPEKTAAATNHHGWTTLGDIGYLDRDGYLFLTDRRAFVINSGGVNIYPQEIENLLVGHESVADVAVIGAPDPDMGEAVVAVVQPRSMAEAGPSLKEELVAFVRSHLSPIKAPRRIDFVETLPRQPTGKLDKRAIRDAYR